MSVSLIIAAVLLAGSFQDTAPPIAPSSSAEQDSPAARLPDVEVQARTLDEAAEAYVRSVASPVARRKMAAWRDPICVGVAGMQSAAAQAMADRVSDWAHSLGVAIRDPGCTPNIFIVAADDGSATARQMVAANPTLFRPGVSDADLGRAALERFQASDRPVRWWHVSLAVDGFTGESIRRMPGQAPFTTPPQGITKPSDLGDYGMSTIGSRLLDYTQDDLIQAIIVVDNDAVDLASFAQVTDFVAMVALAQIDPESEPDSPSILRLFSPSAVQEQTLTEFDRAYLRALYGTLQSGGGTGANMSILADGIRRRVERPAE